MSNTCKDPQSRKQIGFSIRIEGPKVGEARLSAKDLATIVTGTQQAIKRVGQVLYGESSIGKGRKKKDIEEQCEIFLIGWKPGSAVVEFELATPPSQLSLFENIGEESFKAFLLGLETLQAHTDMAAFPRGFDMGVLQACDFFSQVVKRGIDYVRFEPERIEGLPSVTFDLPMRERVRRLLGNPLDRRQIEKCGRLEVLDGHNGLQGRLWEPDGTKWVCIFEPEHLELLPDFWLHTIKVIGKAGSEPTKGHVIEVESVLPLEEEIQQTLSVRDTEASDFWNSLSLEELAHLQGVEATEDIDGLSALWPVDDDPDEMLTHILGERSSRSGIGKEA